MSSGYVNASPGSFELTLFFTHVLLRVCHKANKIQDYNKRHRQKNLEKIRTRSRVYYAAHREAKLTSQNDYYLLNKKDIRAQQKAYQNLRKDIKKDENSDYYAKNKSDIHKQHSSYLVARRKRDLNFRMLLVLRSRLGNVLKGTAKACSTRELLGCSIEFLREHLEKQFVPGMTWENYGPVWHVDHILPCASFDFSQPERQKQCFHFSNLQPLFAADNIRKSDKIL